MSFPSISSTSNHGPQAGQRRIRFRLRLEPRLALSLRNTGGSPHARLLAGAPRQFAVQLTRVSGRESQRFGNAAKSKSLGNASESQPVRIGGVQSVWWIRAELRIGKVTLAESGGFAAIQKWLEWF